MALAQSYELLYLLSPCILFTYIPHRLVTGNLSFFWAKKKIHIGTPCCASSLCYKCLITTEPECLLWTKQSCNSCCRHVPGSLSGMWFDRLGSFSLALLTDSWKSNRRMWADVESRDESFCFQYHARWWGHRSVSILPQSWANLNIDQRLFVIALPETMGIDMFFMSIYYGCKFWSISFSFNRILPVKVLIMCTLQTAEEV